MRRFLKLSEEYKARKTWARTGFTLVELMVVIALLSLLAAIMVPVLNHLVGGKSLRMARNSLAGYLEGIRSEALNRKSDILLVLLPPQDEADTPYTIQAYSPSQERPVDVKVGSGFVPFLIHPASEATNVSQRIQYMGKQKDFNFGLQFADVHLHPQKVRDWQKNTLPLLPTLGASDLKAIGIPHSAYLIYIQADGRALIPGDVPGYLVDGAGQEELNADIVLEDGEALLFLDVSSLLRVRGRLISYDQYKGPFGAP